VTCHADDVAGWLEALRAIGWNVRTRRPRAPRLPLALRERHAPLPGPYEAFLRACTRCHSPDRTVWFLCEADLGVTDPAGFRWDEWERLSLETAAADRDAEFAARVRAFWARHLPVLLSVHSDHAYLAIETSTGRVVSGASPDFEDVTLVCDSFDQVFGLIGRAHEGHAAARAALCSVLWW
jgi:hypothetical protein